jgi:outer membrane protein
MQMRAGLVVALGFSVSAGPALAQPRTLTDALAMAYSTNPTLLAARAQLRSVDENVPQALAGWRPTVTYNAAVGYADGNLRTIGTVAGLGVNTPSTTQSNYTRQNRDEFQENATITQPLYRGGRTAAQTHNAENRVLAQRGRLIATEQQVFSDTVNAFVNVIQSQQLLQLDINNEQVLARQLQATNDRFRVGEITRTDVAQAEAALSAARATRQTAEGNVQTSRATYRRQVGEVPNQLVEPQPIALPVKTGPEAAQLAAANNPSVVFTMFDLAAQKDSVDLAISGLMPTVTGTATAFRQDNTNFPRSRSIGAQALLNLSVPIYQGGAEYAAVRQQRQLEEQARRTVDDTRRQAIQAATSSWETLVAARSTIQSTRDQIRANQIALEGTEREAIVGSRTTLDVLNAQQLLLQSRTTLVQNLANLITSSYNVASAIGRLTAKDLNLQVPLYDETAYYAAVHDRLFGTGDYAIGQAGR